MSSNKNKIIVVRMRGEVGTNREVLDTFRMLGMKKLYSAALLESTPSNMGMVRKVENFAAWGEVTEETEKLLENKLNEAKLRDVQQKDAKGAVQPASSSSVSARFGLKPARGGFKSKKLRYPRGSLGCHGDKINELIKRMV